MEKHIIRDVRVPGESWFECEVCGAKSRSYFIGRTDGRNAAFLTDSEYENKVYMEFEAEECHDTN